MKATQRTRAPALLILMASLCAGLIVPHPLRAQLHDPMRPSRAAAQSTDLSQAEAAEALPPLNAILISATTKVAIFGAQRVHEGERLGRYHIKRIHPGRVELSDGDSHIERRLFPAITTFEDDR